MKKRLCVWFILTAALMLLYPLLTVRFAPAESAMALCFILFYLLAPAFSIAAGIAAGRHIRSMWCLAVLPAFLFVAGTWLCFDMGESAFLLYAAIYLLLGVSVMLLSHVIRYLTLKKRS